MTCAGLYSLEDDKSCMTCAGLYSLEDGPEYVRVVVAPLVLDHGHQALQAHPAIDVLAENHSTLIFLRFLFFNFFCHLLENKKEK